MGIFNQILEWLINFFKDNKEEIIDIVKFVFKELLHLIAEYFFNENSNTCNA